jgi:hypothetical protein
MIGDGLGMFERTAVLQISRNSGGPNGVAARGIGETGRLTRRLIMCSTLKPGHRPVSEPVGLAHTAEERPPLF